jgi:hypothetical protein
LRERNDLGLDVLDGQPHGLEKLAELVVDHRRGPVDGDGPALQVGDPLDPLGQVRPYQKLVQDRRGCAIGGDRDWKIFF